MDMEAGAVLLMGRLHTVARGTLIGSPIAAGASSLVVARKEQKKKRRMSAKAQQEFHERVLALRWMDDLVVLEKNGLSAEGKANLREILKPDAYGKELRLSRSKPGEGFGVIVEAAEEGKILAMQKLNFISRRVFLEQGGGDGVARLCTGLHGGSQFQTSGVSYGVSIGFMLRYLDMGNRCETSMVGGLLRILLELKRMGTVRKVLIRTVKRLRPLAWCRIDILKEAIDWPDAKDAAWRVHFDAQETLREGHGAKMEILEELMCWVASGCG